ncbi:uncharacterized protein UHOD_20509 [Ustilago sp. UG-2017b]|nr:uncharacterized protein UHOD_20509 [Ustilago sp. UG-2017b]
MLTGHLQRWGHLSVVSQLLVEFIHVWEERVVVDHIECSCSSIVCDVGTMPPKVGNILELGSGFDVILACSDPCHLRLRQGFCWRGCIRPCGWIAHSQGFYHLIAKIFRLKPVNVVRDPITIKGGCVSKQPDGVRLCKDGDSSVDPTAVQGYDVRWNIQGVDEIGVCRRD